MIMEESRARGMSAESFFSSDYQRSEGWRSLPILTRRDITASKFGLTWDEYSNIPATIRVQMQLSGAGNTYTSGAQGVLDAARSDLRFSKLSGFLSGMKFGTLGAGMLAAVGIGAVVYFRKPILKALT